MKKNSKRNTAKKNIAKFTNRSYQKKRSADKLRREVLAVLEKGGISAPNLILRDALDRGRGVGNTGKKTENGRRIAGVFLSSSGGYGFVRAREEYSEDIFIPEGSTQGALDGDTVEVIFREYEGYNGQRRTEGRVVRITEIARHTLIGRLEYMQSGSRYRPSRTLVLVPDENRLALRPKITNSAGARPGDKVLVKLIRHKGYPYLTAEVIENFGDSLDREANYAAILAECEIETEFSEEEIREAEESASQPISDVGRVRLDNEIIFTMDGAGAKDLDDAVSLRRVKGGYLLGVHIADVSYYVAERGALARAVMARGTSVYFTDKVVPMLPTALSNGACSLNSGEDKYAISAMISLSNEGDIRSLKLIPTIIHSRVRGVYSEINAIFEGSHDTELRKKYKCVLPALERMRELYTVLAERARKRGYIDLDIPESEILLDKNGSPSEIIKRERGIAERIIEQFMLTANEAVATYLYERGMPCVYRIHERPSPEKLEALVEYSRTLSLPISRISKPDATPCDFSALLSEAENKGILPQVSSVMLRSMAKAQYSHEQNIHFGLGIEKYCHFTSPIRRLADLATHRIIRRVLFDGKPEKAYISYAKRAAAAATDAELRADTAERKIENLYKTVYMSEHIGELYSARVSSVTSFGMFCTLENTCEGLVPISELSEDFYFDESILALRSPRTSYRLGDLVTVCVEEADISRGKLRFSVLEEENNEKSY